MTALADEGLKLVEAMYITIGFAWKPEAHVDVKRVELLISKAEDIYQDHFDHSQEPLIENDKCTTYTLEQWNTEGGSYCACPSLEPGVYQFVFRVDNGTERELQISDYYERTFLGNGRPVNYIELIENSEVDRSTLAVGKRNIIRCKYLQLHEAVNQQSYFQQANLKPTCCSEPASNNYSSQTVKINPRKDFTYNRFSTKITGSPSSMSQPNFERYNNIA